MAILAVNKDNPMNSNALSEAKLGLKNWGHMVCPEEQS